MQDDISSPKTTNTAEESLDESSFSIDKTAPKDDFSDEVRLDNDDTPSPQMPNKKPKRFNLTKKQKILLIVLGIAVLLGLLVASWLVFHKKPTSEISTPKVAKKEEPPKPTTVPSKMTGLPVAPEVNDKQVTAVMIENSPDARPQSGLKEAGIVFEAVAEGGVTRFLALYQDTSSDYIGPIRSARPYYLDWALPFDAALAHVGGSPDALAAIKSLGVKDLDQFANAGSYTRIKTRYAPHNAYSSIGALNDLETKKGFTKSSYNGLARKEKETPGSPPNTTSFDMVMSGYLYNSHWDYDPATNSYKRSEGGKPHTDERSGQQLTAKVVIALVTPKAAMADGYHTAYTTSGSGAVYVYQDGLVQAGTWQKTDSKTQYVFKDAAGKPLALNPGQTWITVIATANDVSPRP